MNSVKNYNALWYERTDPTTHPRHWRRFVELDIFSDPPNRVEGYVCLRPTDQYGALLITEVNGRPAPQPLILATPKAAYPFNKDHTWWLQGYDSINAYTKLDGTNVYQFVYADADGHNHTSFKLRTRFGVSARFRPMLDMAAEGTGLYDIRLPYGVGIGYELYGQRNKMLIRYDEHIALRALYARNILGHIFSIHNQPEFFENWTPIPTAEHHPWQHEVEFQAEYERRQKAYSDKFQLVTGPDNPDNVEYWEW